MRVRSKVDHARMAAWVEHMKGVFQSAIEDYAKDHEISAAGINKVRNNLECLAMIQELVTEHHEMERGRAFDAGSTHINFETIASLIHPDGTVIPIHRRKGNSHG